MGTLRMKYGTPFTSLLPGQDQVFFLLNFPFYQLLDKLGAAAQGGYVNSRKELRIGQSASSSCPRLGPELEVFCRKNWGRWGARGSRDGARSSFDLCRRGRLTPSLSPHPHTPAWPDNGPPLGSTRMDRGPGTSTPRGPGKAAGEESLGARAPPA